MSDHEDEASARPPARAHGHSISHGAKSHNQKNIARLLWEGANVEILECDKTGNIQQRWIHSTDGRITAVDSKGPGGFGSWSLGAWRKALFDAFLPVGYPHSVSDDYLAYQTYDSLQAFFSTITSLLANRALLQGLGVGDANSSATFAMLLTILQDAMSRIATIVFAQRFGLRIEPDAKRYRFLADLFNDTAFFIELYSPYLGMMGKVLALSASQALRALCGVSAGASKAALSVHFAKHDNLAELNAKEASQETAVGLVGLLVGTVVVKYVEGHRSVVLLMIALVLGHLWVNYLGVCSVHMTTLNRQRATILFNEYLQTGRVLCPRQVAKRENILIWDDRAYNREDHAVARIEFAESYKHAMQDVTATTTTSTNENSDISQQTRESCIIDEPEFTHFFSTRQDGFSTVRILLHGNSTPVSAIRAWFYAIEACWHMTRGTGFSRSLEDVLKGGEDSLRKGPMGLAGGSPFKNNFRKADLYQKMEALGWDLNTQAFETSAPVRIRIQAAVRKDE
jgi:hypothetical protein